MNQSKVELLTSCWREARENKCERVTIGSVLVLLLFGWKNGASFVDQLLFDPQMKIALYAILKNYQQLFLVRDILESSQHFKCHLDSTGIFSGSTNNKLCFARLNFPFSLGCIIQTANGVKFLYQGVKFVITINDIFVISRTIFL